MGALRRALEPDRPARARSTLLVTEGPGYALRTEAVDAWRFERAVEAAAALPAEDVLARLGEALGLVARPAYADFADAGWARAERSRLAELRLQAVERVASARLALGRAAEAVPDLDAHVAEHPWREDAWGLLALALYRSGRQGDALAVLRRARGMLVEELGVDPGPGLRRLEADILNHADHLAARGGTAAVGRGVGARRRRLRPHGGRGRPRAAGVDGRPAARPAVTGGLEAARGHRAAAVAAAEELGDPELTARVIGAYDVPAIWTRVDDPQQAARIVAAAERTLTALGPDAHAPRGPGCWRRSRSSHAARAPAAGLRPPARPRRRPPPRRSHAARLRLQRRLHAELRADGAGAAAGRDRRRADRPLRPARPRHLRGPRAPDPPSGPLRTRRTSRPPTRHAARRGRAGRARTSARSSAVFTVVPSTGRSSSPRSRPTAKPLRFLTEPECPGVQHGLLRGSRCSAYACGATSRRPPTPTRARTRRGPAHYVPLAAGRRREAAYGAAQRPGAAARSAARGHVVPRRPGGGRARRPGDPRTRPRRPRRRPANGRGERDRHLGPVAAYLGVRAPCPARPSGAGS